MAQRISTYEKTGSLQGRPFTTRGMKTFQFVLTASGWRIIAVAWDDARDGLTLDDARTFATGSLSPRGAIKDEPSPEDLMGEGTLGRGDPLDIVIEEPEEYVDRDQVLRAFGEGAEYSLGAFADISDDEVDPLAPGETKRPRRLLPCGVGLSQPQPVGRTSGGVRSAPARSPAGPAMSAPSSTEGGS